MDIGQKDAQAPVWEAVSNAVSHTKRGVDMVTSADRNAGPIEGHLPFAVHDIVIFIIGIGSGMGVCVDPFASAGRDVEDHEIGRGRGLIKAEIAGADRALAAIEIWQVFDHIGFAQDHAMLVN